MGYHQSEKECFVLHPELHPKEDGDVEREEKKNKVHKKEEEADKKKIHDNGKKKEKLYQEPKVMTGDRRGGYLYMGE